MLQCPYVFIGKEGITTIFYSTIPEGIGLLATPQLSNIYKRIYAAKIIKSTQQCKKMQKI